eukprot:TRINITY_DN16517_c0_g1_i1.p1 TRINITY_DN16517_c0_g1~~TRINITY_DN16517_c0_g1_i1.p1  ORF type:complete len:333 (-),score=53.54 TRINITY_DN16517_c0_g1_i1:187-1185(-)
MLARTSRSGSRLRTNKSLVSALAVVSATVWYCWTSFEGTSFVSGSVSRVPSRTAEVARRAGGYEFNLKEDKDHDGLQTQEKENGVRIMTDGKDHFMDGRWNTVLGDKPVPASGRSYWEVKFVRKPSNAWEYIGIAEENADVTVPLTRNVKGKGWFWGGNWFDSFVYTHLEMRKEWNTKKVAQAEAFAKRMVKTIKELAKEEKSAVEQARKWHSMETHLTGPGTHVGQSKIGIYPTFEKGLVVGIDVDMDDGSVALWANGEYLGLMKDTEGKKLNLKGKKVFPAVSIFGRHRGVVSESSVMEIRTGLEPPGPRPAFEVGRGRQYEKAKELAAA